MDLAKTGKFIAERRKEKGLTQVKLAEILHVSEKTISKWECGKGFPDTTLMLPLCEALSISANELLSGKILHGEDYKNSAEENLILLKNQQQRATRRLLFLEIVVGYMSIVTFIALIFIGANLINPLAWKIVVISMGFIHFIIGTSIAISIERNAGFYQCAHCHHRYIPSFKSFFFSMHIGRTRYLKCPNCKKRSWNKKTIEKL